MSNNLATCASLVGSTPRSGRSGASIAVSQTAISCGPDGDSSGPKAHELCARVRRDACGELELQIVSSFVQDGCRVKMVAVIHVEYWGDCRTIGNVTASRSRRMTRPYRLLHWDTARGDLVEEEYPKYCCDTDALRRVGSFLLRSAGKTSAFSGLPAATPLRQRAAGHMNRVAASLSGAEVAQILWRLLAAPVRWEHSYIREDSVFELLRDAFIRCAGGFRAAGGFAVLGCLSCVELPQSCPIVFQRKESC